jgi:hypothetical protein
MAKIVGEKSAVWKGNADVTKGGKTKKDILRLSIGNGKYRYVFKSRYNQGKKMMQNPNVKAAFERMKIPKKNGKSKKTNMRV